MGFFRRSPDPARLAASAPAGPLRDFLSTPQPDPATPAADLPLLAVDMETTGLDPTRDTLLSIGYVPVNGKAVALAGAGHVVLRQQVEVGQSATLHGITDDELAAGTDPAQAVEQLLDALRGRVLLAHHAALEVGFLQQAVARSWGVELPLAPVDTMQLQYRILTKGFDDEPPRGALRLWSARDQYGLPHYQAHEALTDALACAELYLAQLEHLGWQTPLRKLR